MPIDEGLIQSLRLEFWELRIRLEKDRAEINKKIDRLLETERRFNQNED